MNAFKMRCYVVTSAKYFNGTSLLHLFFSRVLKLIPKYSKLQMNV